MPLHCYHAPLLLHIPNYVSPPVPCRAFTNAWYRRRLHVLLLGLGAWSWGSAVVGRTWETLLSVFGEALFE